MAAARTVRRGLEVAGAEARLRMRGERAMARAVAAYYRSGPDAESRQWSERIEAVRADLVADQRPLDSQGTLAHVAKVGSRPRRAALMLLSLVRETGARSVVELGTCVGVSGAYIAAGLRLNGGGRLITLEASPERVVVARSVFKRLDLAIDARAGYFADTLPDALADAAPVDLLFIDGHHQEEPTVDYYQLSLPHLAPGAIVMFDDIRWSDGMRRAWRRVGEMPETAVHVDVSGMGLVRTSR